TIGSFRAQGREEKDWAPIEGDARAVAEAGAFAVVIEAVAEPLAARITTQGSIPTICTGASPACGGPTPVAGGPLRPFPLRPEVRQARWRPRPFDRGCGKSLCGRRARPRVSRPRQRLWHEEAREMIVLVPLFAFALSPPQRYLRCQHVH